jgi:AcrR family transcriptional regulator
MGCERYDRHLPIDENRRGNSMPPQKSTEARRLPQRQRGRERVAALLEAAAACFVEKGYDGATMTEIAARAGASIGSLYQFFPTKEALAHALIEDYAQALFGEVAKLAERSEDLDTSELSVRLSMFLITFRKRHPAFVMLVESGPVPAADGMSIRRRLRAELQALLTRRAPHRSAEDMYAVAVTVQQMMKAAVAIQAEPGMPGRQKALSQLQDAMQLYLHGVFSE